MCPTVHAKPDTPALVSQQGVAASFEVFYTGRRLRRASPERPNRSSRNILSGHPRSGARFF